MAPAGAFGGRARRRLAATPALALWGTLCAPLAQQACGGPGPARLRSEASKFCRAERQVECEFRPDQEDYLLPRERGLPKRRRLLVFVVGVRERLYPIPTLRHVVAPAVRAGYIVDYYAILSMRVAGPESFRAFWYRPVANPEFANYTAEEIQDYLVRRAKSYGARHVGILMLANDTAQEPLPEFIFRHERFIGENVGLGKNGKFDATQTLWLWLLRLRKVELLWNWTVAHRIGVEYDHVLWTRTDTYWVDDLHMEHFPDRRGVYSRNFGALCNKVLPGVVNDQSVVLGGQVAGHILTSYTAFYRNKDRRLSAAHGPEKWLAALATVRGVRWTIVRQDWFPFFLALHMHEPGKKEPTLCFRGLTRGRFEQPLGECIHESKLKPFCDELGLV